jgi:hypothetical protein
MYIHRSRKLDKIVHALESKPPEFAACVVKTVLISVLSTKVDTLVRLCKGITKITSKHLSLECMEHIRPKRICVALDGQLAWDRPAGDLLNLPFFANVTHFEIFASDFNIWCFPFENLPNLTHLALPDKRFDKGSTEPDGAPRIMATCHRLQILLIEVHRDLTYLIPDVLKPWCGEQDKPRIITWAGQGYAEDWEDHEIGDDIWVKAQRNLRNRKCDPSSP